MNYFPNYHLEVDLYRFTFRQWFYCFHEIVFLICTLIALTLFLYKFRKRRYGRKTSAAIDRLEL